MMISDFHTFFLLTRPAAAHSVKQISIINNPLCPAVITAAPVSTETTGIGVNVLRGSPAQTAGSVSVDL